MNHPVRFVLAGVLAPLGMMAMCLFCLLEWYNDKIDQAAFCGVAALWLYTIAHDYHDHGGAK
jgi:hypothetical protein